MTNANDDFFTMDSSSHEYIHKAHPDVSFTSVTTFIEQFFEKFDGPAIAKRLCETIPRYADRKPEELLQEWKEAADFGSKVHAEVLAYIQSGNDPSEPRVKAAIQWLQQNTSPDIELYPEIRSYDVEHALAGTADLLVHDKKKNIYSLFDWKTNKAIEKKPFGGKKGTHPVTAHLDDCNFVRYSLQLSLYKYLLENEKSIFISSMTILHIAESGIVEYPANDYTALIPEMLKAERQKP